MRVALDYSTTDDPPVASRVIVFRSGGVIVVLVGYGNQGVPTDALNETTRSVAELAAS